MRSWKHQAPGRATYMKLYAYNILLKRLIVLNRFTVSSLFYLLLLFFHRITFSTTVWWNTGWILNWILKALLFLSVNRMLVQEKAALVSH